MIRFAILALKFQSSKLWWKLLCYIFLLFFQNVCMDDKEVDRGKSRHVGSVGDTFYLHCYRNFFLITSRGIFIFRLLSFALRKYWFPSQVCIPVLAPINYSYISWRSSGPALRFHYNCCFFYEIFFRSNIPFIQTHAIYYSFLRLRMIHSTQCLKLSFLRASVTQMPTDMTNFQLTKTAVPIRNNFRQKRVIYSSPMRSALKS